LIGALRNPERAAALLVTRPEELVVVETERYAADLTSNGIRIAAVVVNAASGDRGDAVDVQAPRYLVPLLAEPPIGATGLLQWTHALTDRVTTRREGPRTGRRARRSTAARAEPTSWQADKLLFPSLTIVGGKGGVGKTTAACALAIVAAGSTPDVLLVSTDPAPSIGDGLRQLIGDRETPVDGVRGLVARQMDATTAFREFQRGYQQRIDALFDGLVRHGVDARHDREILRELLALAPPGIDELYALASLGETLDERRFARVIVDPAPTGHLLRLLQMPPLALDWSHRLMRLMLKYRDVGGLGDSAQDVLAFARRTRRVGEMLRDPHSAGMVIVALDEALVRGETARLVSASRAEGLAVGAVLWNRWPGRELPEPLPVEPPVAQFVAPAAAPPPVGATALRAWVGQWREASDGDG
jgi:arsenite-transporting ATPase